MKKHHELGNQQAGHREERKLDTIRLHKNFQRFAGAFYSSDMLSFLSSCRVGGPFIYRDEAFIKGALKAVVLRAHNDTLTIFSAQ